MTPPSPPNPPSPPGQPGLRGPRPRWCPAASQPPRVETKNEVAREENRVFGSAGDKHPHPSLHSHRCKLPRLGQGTPPRRRGVRFQPVAAPYVCPPQSCAGGAPTLPGIVQRPQGGCRCPPAPERRARGEEGTGAAPLVSRAATRCPPAQLAHPSPGALRQLSARPGESREKSARRGTRGARGSPGPDPWPHSLLTQVASSSSSHAGPARAIPAAAAHRRLSSAPGLPRPPASSAAATSQPLPASEFPVPRLPKHAHHAGRGARGQVLAGTCSSSSRLGWDNPQDSVWEGLGPGILANGSSGRRKSKVRE